jgi:hypothetical protein
MKGLFQEDFRDPEFTDDKEQADVKAALEKVEKKITKLIGPERKPVLDVVDSPRGLVKRPCFDERDLRLIRYALYRVARQL